MVLWNEVDWYIMKRTVLGKPMEVVVKEKLSNVNNELDLAEYEICPNK